MNRTYYRESAKTTDETAPSRFVPLLAVIAIFLLFIYGSYSIPLIGPDEPRYTQVARQMYESGDFITPRLGPLAWFEKPVLLYWLMIPLFHFFGVNEFAARLPSALAAMCTIFFTYSAVKQAAGYRKAILTALILATNLFVIGFSHAATFDMLLTAFLTVSFVLFLRFEFQGESKFLYAMYAAVGLAILAKGFVALILSAITITGYYVIFGHWSKVFRLRLVRGALITSAVTAIWFLPISLIYGWRFWDEFFFQHHLMRYTSSYYHRSGGIFYYVPILLLGTYPWSLAPFLGLRLQNHQKIILRFCLVWFFGALIFFSFSRSKLPGYILPAIPAFSVLSACAIVDYFQSKTTFRRIFLLLAVLSFAMIAALLWAFQFVTVDTNRLLLLPCAVLVPAVAAFLLLWSGRLWKALAVYAAIPILLLLVLAHLIIPRMNFEESRELSKSFLAVAQAADKLVVYNVYDFSILFYTNARVELTPEGYLYTLRDYRQLYKYVTRNKKAFVLVMNEELHWMKSANFWKVENILRGKERSIVHLRSNQ